MSHAHGIIKWCVSLPERASMLNASMLLYREQHERSGQRCISHEWSSFVTQRKGTLVGLIKQLGHADELLTNLITISSSVEGFPSTSGDNLFRLLRLTRSFNVRIMTCFSM